MICAIGDDIVVGEVIVVDATGLIAIECCLFVVVDLVETLGFAMAAFDSYQKKPVGNG